MVLLCPVVRVEGEVLRTGCGEHVVELDDEVVVSVEPLEADVRRRIDVWEVLVQLHLRTFVIVVLVSFLVILRRVKI